MPGMNAIYEEHDPDDLPPELQPLPDVDWGALSSRAVQRLVDKLPDEMLDDDEIYDDQNSKRRTSVRAAE